MIASCRKERSVWRRKANRGSSWKSYVVISEEVLLVCLGEYLVPWWRSSLRRVEKRIVS